MPQISQAFLAEQLELADQLLAGRDAMLEPQDLPGRYGRVVKAIDRILQATNIEAVVGGGWAVWRYGYVGRVTQDIDIALPADQIDEFRQVAAVSGFDLLPIKPGRWPKQVHRETKVQVDILPEGARPGTAKQLAPTTIPHPSDMGATSGRLRYMNLPRLIELKLAAGRPQDEADVAALLRANELQVPQLRAHVGSIHADYLAAFDRLAKRAADLKDDR